MSLISEYVINPVEYERMAESRDKWKLAAESLMEFIQEHVRIVGFDEIEAYRKAKTNYEKAVF